MSRRSWCDASQPGVQLKSTSSVRKVMEVLTSELYQIHPLSQSSRRYVLPPSPCHANDAPCTSLPLHIKGTKSRGLLFKSFTFIWHSVTRCTVSKPKLCIPCLPSFPDALRKEKSLFKLPSLQIKMSLSSFTLFNLQGIFSVFHTFKLAKSPSFKPFTAPD